MVALVLHVERTEGTGVAVALLLLAQTIPRLLGPLAGALADRVNRKDLLIVCDLGQTAIFIVIALLAPGFAVLLGLVASSALLATVFAPTSHSIVPALVRSDDLMGANTWLGFVFNLQIAVGPVLGGLLFVHLGLRGALLVDAATFLASGLFLLGLPSLAPSRQAPGERMSFLRSTKEGLLLARRHPVARAVTVTLFLGVAFAGLDNVALVFLARDALDAGPTGYGILASGFGAGMVIASVLLLFARDRLTARSVFLGGWLLTGLGTLLTGLAPVLAIALFMQASAGIGNAAENVAGDTLLQRSVPSEVLGRVFGLATTGAYVGGGVAYAIGGFLLDLTSARAVFVIGGVGTLGILVLARLMLPPGSGEVPIEPAAVGL